MKSISVHTLGCKVNQYESQELTELLRSSGYESTENNSSADIFIINSCTVTAESSRKTRQLVRKLKREHPDSIVILTGCLPQAFPEEAEKIKEADIITGNSEKYNIPDLINKYLENRERIVSVIKHKRNERYQSFPVTKFEGHTRAFIKIQDGCNRYCSYCAIPYAKGFSRSKPIDDIKRELVTFAEKGFKEIVFVGINITSYGLDFDSPLNIADVCSAAEENGIARIRLGSLEPDHITDDVINRLKNIPGFCPQFHLSLQSGSDRILKKMNRHYSAKEYLELTRKIRKSCPGASITTDIIVGFPGETDSDFTETAEFVKTVGFEKVHIFPFSRREGTPAASMPDQISNTVKARRAAALGKICADIRTDYFKSLIGNEYEVLFEEGHNGMQNGYSPNYTPVSVETAVSLKGSIHKVKITSADKDGCKGVLSEGDLSC